MQRVGNTVGPLIVTTQHGLDDSNADELTQTPTEVDISGEMPTQGHGADLRRVGDGKGLENTPRDTAHNLRSKERLDVLRGEEEGDEGGQPRQTGDDGLAIAEAFGRPAVEDQTDDFANDSTVTEASLPLVVEIRLMIGFCVFLQLQNIEFSA